MRDADILHIVVPVFNEAENFPGVYRAITEYIHAPYNILVVYDFDEDTTVPVARALAATDSRLKLVRNTIGRGPLNALRAGFAAVESGPILVTMGDLSDDLRDVDAMMALYRHGSDVVCGSRYMNGGRQAGGPFVKSALSRIAGLSLYYLRGVSTHDITNNFKIYNSDFIKSISIESTMGFSIAMEITAKAFIDGKSIAEVPTTWRNRPAGTSTFKLWKWLPQYLRWYLYAFQPRRGNAR